MPEETEIKSAASPSRGSTDWLHIALMLASGALAVLVFLLARENLHLKDVVTRLGQNRNLPPADVFRPGEQFAAPALLDASGQARVLPDDGRAKLLLVFNPDCHACEEERPVWQQLLEDPALQSVDAYAVMLDANATPPPEWFELSGAELLMSPGSNAGSLEKVPSTPSVLLLDGAGRVNAFWVGTITKDRRDEILYRLSLLP
ncbi:MAG: hypothetical protein J5J06_14420 [Phycisphaerae bacterium]|nr:hypothetical protein [Phycisphaerae bacterium]